MSITPEAAKAIEEIQATVTRTPRGRPGPAGRDLGRLPDHIQYPYSDIHPHFVRSDIALIDGRPLGDGTGMNEFDGKQAVQLSRRSNHLNPTTDTAAIKLLNVLQWLRTRP